MHNPLWVVVVVVVVVVVYKVSLLKSNEPVALWASLTWPKAGGKILDVVKEGTNR